MGTIAQKLQYLSNAKTAIAGAIASKGQTVQSDIGTFAASIDALHPLKPSPVDGSTNLILNVTGYASGGASFSGNNAVANVAYSNGKYILTINLSASYGSQGGGGTCSLQGQIVLDAY